MSPNTTPSAPSANNDRVPRLAWPVSRTSAWSAASRRTPTRGLAVLVTPEWWHARTAEPLARGEPDLADADDLHCGDVQPVRDVPHRRVDPDTGAAPPRQELEPHTVS